MPEFVTVTGVSGALRRDIQTTLPDLAGEPVDAEQLERKLELLGGSERFSSFSYYLTREDGKQGLKIHADENGYAPPFLKLGILVDGAQYRRRGSLRRT